MRNALVLTPRQLVVWRRRQRGRKIVFTAGSFDLLHVGHLRFLAKARTCGDLLVVGVPGNESLRRLKGPGRPLIDEKARAESLAALIPVDIVVIFNEDTVAKVLQLLQPEVFFTVDEGWNKGWRESREYKIVKSYGGEVVLSPRQSPFISASAIIRRVAGLVVKEVFREVLAEEGAGDPFSEDWKKVQLKLKI